MFSVKIRDKNEMFCEHGACTVRQTAPEYLNDPLPFSTSIWVNEKPSLCDDESSYA